MRSLRELKTVDRKRYTTIDGTPYNALVRSQALCGYFLNLRIAHQRLEDVKLGAGTTTEFVLENSALSPDTFYEHIEQLKKEIGNLADFLAAYGVTRLDRFHDLEVAYEEQQFQNPEDGVARLRQTAEYVYRFTHEENILSQFDKDTIIEEYIDLFGRVKREHDFRLVEDTIGLLAQNIHGALLILQFVCDVAADAYEYAWQSTVRGDQPDIEEFRCLSTEPTSDGFRTDGLGISPELAASLAARVGAILVFIFGFLRNVFSWDWIAKQIVGKIIDVVLESIGLTATDLPEFLVKYQGHAVVEDIRANLSGPNERIVGILPDRFFHSELLLSEQLVGPMDPDVLTGLPAAIALYSNSPASSILYYVEIEDAVSANEYADNPLIASLPGVSHSDEILVPISRQVTRLSDPIGIKKGGQVSSVFNTALDDFKTVDVTHDLPVLHLS